MSGAKQLKITDKQKICCNLLQMDMLTYNQSIQGAVNDSYTCDKYYELQVVEDENGYHEELVEVDYPITQESVASYADSADYRNDVAGAIANGQANKRANLGDITAYQEALKMDTALIADLANRLKTAQELLNVKQSASANPVSAEATTTTNTTEGGK